MRKHMDEQTETLLGPLSAGQDTFPAMERSVLLVVAGRSQADQLRWHLAERGASVEIARSVSGAIERLENYAFDAVMVDWKTITVEHLGGDWREGWFRLVDVARARHAHPVGLVMLADDDARDAELAVPALIAFRSSAEDAPELVRRAIEQHAAELGLLTPYPSAKRVSTPGALDSFLIGESAAIRRVVDQIHLVAPKDTTVLITGETGTGKERVSRAIHLLSRRLKNPMVSVNCGGIPATLLEDEFFGHVKGAFTDARNARIGRFEQAHGSTIFLDEIGDLPLELQPKLLRVLQEREIHRIGGVEAVQLDVRVIAATNLNLWRQVEDGRFREDLFYRINVFPIHVPPLRERRDDIPLFVRYFIEKFCKRDQLRLKRLAPSAEEPLKKRPWRGNIRELENAVEIAVIRSQERTDVTIDDFPIAREAPLPIPELPDPSSATVDFRALVQKYEQDLIAHALEMAGGNKNRAAQILQMKRTTLTEKMKRLAGED